LTKTALVTWSDLDGFSPGVGLMPILLDTADLPARDRTDAIHAAMTEASAPCFVIHEHLEDSIHARMELWDFGTANVFSTWSSGIQLLRTAKQARQDAMPVVALSVQKAADGRQDQLAHQRVVPPGEMLVMDLSAPYDFSWSGNGAAGCVQIPIEHIGLPVDVIRRAAARLPSSPLYRLVTGHVDDLTRDAARLSADPSAPALGAATVELARALLSSAAYDEQQARPVMVETLLTQIRAYVRAHLADPDLRPATIAAAHHISVRYLYKVCAQAELSLEQWIIGERLQGARAELVRPESRGRSIAMIARRWGFGDPTHFSRRFRAAYGLSPREWRRIAAEADPPALP
jgi:AraC-like DNA-binding protein